MPFNIGAVSGEHKTDFKVVALVAIVFFLLIGLIGLWTWRLNREVKRRKFAELEIERALGMLQLVLDTVPIGVFWQDKMGRFLGCNRNFSNMLGIASPFELVGKAYSDIPGTEFSEAHFLHNKQVIQDDTPLLGMGEQIVKSDGSRLFLRTNRITLHDRSGSVIGLLMTLEDVSAVRDSQIRNSAITEATLECLITIDHHGMIVDFNPAAEETFGYSRLEAVGASLGELIIPRRHHEAHYQGMEQYIKTGVGPILRKRIEISAMRRNGEEFPVELTVVPFEEGGQTYFLGSMRDISERKDLEAEKQRVTILLEDTINTLRARQLAMDLHASVTISDLNGIILFANEKFCEISQYSKEELIGNNHSMLKSGLHDEAYYKDMWSTISSGKVWQGEIINCRKDGEIYWLLATISPVLGEDGKPVQYISVRTDITSQRKTEYELDMARGRELSIGNQIQRTLLFGDVPSKVGTTELDVHTEPSMGIDGDFYEFFMHSPQMFDVVIGDVMGKGIPAALIGAAVKLQLNRVMTEQLSTSSRVPQPEQVINSLHRNISPQLIDLERFVTMAYVRCDLVRKEATIVDAGHTRTIFSSKKGMEFLTSDNLPLGVVETENYVQNKIRFASGDMLFLYSDGVTEAKNDQDEVFGEERLGNLINEMYLADIPATILSQAIRYQVREFEQMLSPSDDRTLVAVKFDSLERIQKDVTCFDLSWQTDALDRIRTEVNQASLKAGLSDDAAGALTLAGFEVVTNILRHATQLLADATLHCNIEDRDNDLSLIIYYVGEPFFPQDIEPDFSGDSDGGFGLYIIRNSVDEVIFDSPATGVCRVVMRKHKHGASPNDKGVPN